MEKKLRDLESTIKNRRTVKLFTDKKINPDIIRKGIELARWAPNHHLTEPWHFYILNSSAIKESVELIRTVVTERKGEKIGNFKAEGASKIPGWMVVTCKKSESELTQQEDYASVCCAIQNFSLYLSEAGLASKWSTGLITRDQRFYDLLKINRKSEFIVGLIWYGYPKTLPNQSRGELDSIMTILD
jgi:nitroreductase